MTSMSFLQSEGHFVAILCRVTWVAKLRASAGRPEDVPNRSTLLDLPVKQANDIIAYLCAKLHAKYTKYVYCIHLYAFVCLCTIYHYIHLSRCIPFRFTFYMCDGQLQGHLLPQFSCAAGKSSSCYPQARAENAQETVIISLLIV